MRRLFAVTAVFVIVTFSAVARAEVDISLGGHAVEGGLMMGRTQPGATLTLDGKPVPVSADGHFLIGFGRDDAGSKLLRARLGADTAEQLIDVRDRTFKVERIDGLPKRKVTPDPEAIKRIRREKTEMAAAKATSDPSPAYLDGFAWPVTGRLSGVYGSQRVLNGKPRRPHYGTDVAAAQGTPVRALAGGRVAFVHPGMFFNGKTVLIDHGLGLKSVYIHLDETAVAAGQRIVRGDRIGTVGKTGRTTGPHLHFGLTLEDTPLDPEVVLGPMPE